MHVNALVWGSVQSCEFGEEREKIAVREKKRQREEDGHKVRAVYSCAAVRQREGGKKKEVLLLMDSWGQIHFPHSVAVSAASVNTIQISVPLGAAL